jgi:RNA polymerase-binding protein DksA
MAKAAKKPATRSAAKPAKKPAAKKAKAPARKPVAAKATKSSRASATKAAKAPSKKAAKAPAKATKAPAAKATKPATKAPASKAPPKPKKPSGPPFSARQLERLRGLLREARQRHLHTAEELEAEAETLATEREPGDTQFDEESGEGDTISVERERDLVQAAAERQTVDEIDEAVARMDGGKYGVCVSCGARIPVARLEVIPWTELCVDCKARGERRR